jgi:branched-chain amino acid transport system substrate-binding protein
MYEGGFREPMIAWWPGKINASTASDEVVMGFDFYPTLVELAGGTITKTYVKKQSDDNFIHETLYKIEKEEINGMFAFLNGNIADNFFRSAHRRNLNIPIITTSFAAEDGRLMNLGEAGLGIDNFCTWTKNLKDEENQLFISRYKKQYSKEPDQFSFLGYETGLILYDSLAKCKGDFAGNHLANKISDCKISSPGGNITINKNSGLVKNSVYLCKTTVSGFNFPENKIVGEYVPVSEFEEAFTSLDTNLRSGWLNPYLFV